MTRVQQLLSVVCVSLILFATQAFAELTKIDTNLQLTVLVSSKKVEIGKDETSGSLPKIPAPEGRQPGMGSGIIFTSEGHIITNHHVIANGGDISVWLFDKEDMTEYKATIVGSDPLSDIAILKIDLKDFKYPPVEWGEVPNFGDDIYVIGHPQGMIWSVSKGIVSNPDRYVSTPWQRLIQSDALIMPGNSGGPLFDDEGKLVGINTLMVFSRDPQAKTQAWTMSIHIDDVRWVVDRIMKYGETRRPALNVEVEYDDKKREVTIAPMQDSALADQGFTTGLLLQLGDNKIEKFGDIFEFLKLHKDGDVVKLKVLEDGVEKVYDLPLVKWDRLKADPEPEPKKEKDNKPYNPQK